MKLCVLLTSMATIAIVSAQRFDSEEEFPNFDFESVEEILLAAAQISENADIENISIEPEVNEDEEGDNVFLPLAGGDWRQQGLNLHNKYRAAHGSSPLHLSDELNRSAQNCANYMASKRIFSHVCKGQFGHKYGENLAKRFERDANTATQASITSWYNERSLYNYQNGQFTPQTGHFTQVVWASSQKLGLGFAQNGDFIVVVAHYDPHGNFQGQFQNNVKKPRF